MQTIFGTLPINPVNIETLIIKENWSCLGVISDVNFFVNSPLVPCILTSVNVKPTRVLKMFCDHPNLTSEHVNNISSRPLLPSITKGPEQDVTRNFTNSVRADMDIRHCISPSCFSDHGVTSCMRLLLKGPWFTLAHAEIGGSASFASLTKGIKI